MAPDFVRYVNYVIYLLIYVMVVRLKDWTFVSEFRVNAKITFEVLN
jgi:hypothetical protein